MKIAITVVCVVLLGLIGWQIERELPECWQSTPALCRSSATDLVEEVRGMRIAQSQALIDTLKTICEQQGRAWEEGQNENGPSYTCHALEGAQVEADSKEVLDAGASTSMVRADFQEQVRECTRGGRTAVTRQLGRCFAMVCVGHRAAQSGLAAARVNDEIEACAAKGSAL